MASAKPETGLSKRASGPLSKKERTLSVGALEAALFRAFPKEDVEDWDRAGLTVGDPSRQVTRVAVALDPTVAAIHEAASRGANVLVTHHPAFLDPPSEFKPGPSAAVSPGAVVWAAIESGVAVMSFHTGLDASPHCGAHASQHAFARLVRTRPRAVPLGARSRIRPAVLGCAKATRR